MASAALLMAAALVVWAVPSPVGDLFVSLAGGRDVVQGRLGGRDDWSFMTGGRVWIDQNWLSHLLIYATWRSGGETGLLVLKALLLAAMVTLIFVVARARGRHWPTAAALSAGLVLACYRFVQLRPNLLTLVFVPLAMLLLYRSQDDARRLWWMVPLMALWANVHGGFVFGLGMVGLWVACAVADEARRRGRVSIGTHRQPLACLAACLAACAVSPFGMLNLVHPLVIASSTQWRQVPEWQPLLSNDRLALPWEFFIVLGVVLLLGLLRLSSRDVAGRKPVAAQQQKGFGPSAFEFLLLGLATIMAFQSRRFVPVAIVSATLPLASLLAWLARRPGRIVAIAACAGVAVAVAAAGWRSVQVYRADNPLRAGSTVFDRMHDVSDKFPSSAGRYLGGNGISGNALAEWEWEGYLRWVDPQIRLLVGGRAQQVYPAQVLDLLTDILTTERGPQLLRENHVELVIVSQSPRYLPLVSRLFATRQWADVYNDGRVVVLVDVRSQSGARIARQTLAGRLRYPSAMIREFSLATCMLTAEASPDTASIVASLRRANLDRPTPKAYEALGALSVRGSLADSTTAYLEREALRLASLQPRGKGAQDMRLARIAIHQVLARLYRAGSRGAEAMQAENRAVALIREATAVQAAWH